MSKLDNFKGKQGTNTFKERAKDINRKGRPKAFSIQSELEQIIKDDCRIVVKDNDVKRVTRTESGGYEVEIQLTTKKALAIRVLEIARLNPINAKVRKTVKYITDNIYKGLQDVEIYALIHDNKVIYVGSTKNAQKRYKQHLNTLKRKSVKYPIYEYCIKNNIEPEMKILAKTTCTLHEGLELEKQYIVMNKDTVLNMNGNPNESTVRQRFNLD